MILKINSTRGHTGSLPVEQDGDNQGAIHVDLGSYADAGRRSLITNDGDTVVRFKCANAVRLCAARGMQVGYETHSQSVKCVVGWKNSVIQLDMYVGPSYYAPYIVKRSYKAQYQGKDRGGGRQKKI